MLERVDAADSAAKNSAQMAWRGPGCLAGTSALARRFLLLVADRPLLPGRCASRDQNLLPGAFLVSPLFQPCQPPPLPSPRKRHQQ
eukprot:5158023-Pleurochrysis_carterae.AAC.5